MRLTVGESINWPVHHFSIVSQCFHNVLSSLLETFNCCSVTTPKRFIFIFQISTFNKVTQETWRYHRSRPGAQAGTREESVSGGDHAHRILPARDRRKWQQYENILGKNSTNITWMLYCDFTNPNKNLNPLLQLTFVDFKGLPSVYHIWAEGLNISVISVFFWE